MIAPYREAGIVLDIGSGDGRFVCASAKATPEKFFIGIDANAKPLEKPSIRITRKPAKGGLPNAMFVQAAVEDLPEELNATAAEIHVNFPWGSLLRAVAAGDGSILAVFHRILTPGGRLMITIGTDPERDRGELARLGLPELTADYFRELLVPRYEAAGFRCTGFAELTEAEWRRIETSWARKLSGNHSRRAFSLSFARTG